MKRFRQRKAFTIVEMVIVIAVIAILATVLVPTFGGIIQKANHSADTQFAASLNVQLAMWQVDHGQIQNESDLRKAIDEYYGYGFYSELSPKSAPQGYHYWWNVAEKRVDLKAVTIDDIPDTALASTEDIDFDINNPRCFTFKDGNTYLLMDRKGDNALTNAVEKMDAMSDSGDFGALVALLKSTQKTPVDQGLYNMLLSNLQSVAVFNHGGIFSFNTEISHLYIPQTAQTLGTSHYVCTDGSVSDGTLTYAATLKKVYVPSSVKFLEGSAIFGRTGVAADNPLRNGAIELHMNIEAADLGSHFDIAATDCVIVLPTGRYVQNGNGFDLLTATGANKVDGATSKYTVTVESFQINPTNSNKAVIEDGKIYIAEDAGSVTLNAHTFVGKDQTGATVNNYVPGSVTLTFDNGQGKISGTDSVTFNLSQVKEGDKITITAQETSYTYTVVIDTATSIYDVTINSISKYAFSGTNDNPNYVYNIDYTSGAVWEVAYKITSKYGKTTIDTATIASSALGVLEPVDNKDQLTVKATDGLKKANITLTRGSASRVCEVTLIDASKLPFEIDPYANTLVNFGLTFVIGTEGAVTLDHLFDAKNLDEVGHYVHIRYKDGYSKVLKDQWANYDIVANDIKTHMTELFPGDETTATLELYIGNSAEVTDQKTLTLTVVKGVKNVTGTSGWGTANGTNYTGLALLRPITTNTPISISGGATLYGNYQIIKTSYTGDGLNFISMQNGHLKNVIINGPIYPQVAGSKDGSKYFCHGVSISVYDGEVNTVSDSYISGFRAPVRVNSYSTNSTKATVTFTNTVLDGGVYANLYVWCKQADKAGVNLVLYGCTTIQNGYQSTEFTDNPVNVIGTGIMLDTSVIVTLTMDDETRQFNWFHEADMNTYSGTSDFYAQLFAHEKDWLGRPKDAYQFGNILHGAQNAKHAQAGIVWEYSRTDNWNSSVTCSKVPSNYTSDNYDMAIKKITAWGIKPDGCSHSCSHEHTANNIQIGTKTFATYEDLVAYLNQ